MATKKVNLAKVRRARQRIALARRRQREPYGPLVLAVTVDRLHRVIFA